MLSENGFRCLYVRKIGKVIEIINQLKISYIEGLFSIKSKLLMILIRLFVYAPITIWALFLSCLFPKNEAFYFDIFVFAEKIDDVHKIKKL
jgi:hypothetical protein